MAFLAGAASDQLYAILLDTPPPSEQPEDVAEIGGITPPNAIEIRWMPADGGAQTLVASAQGGRGLQFVGTDSSRIYFTTNRGLQSITLDGLDRRTLLRVQGVGPGNNPPSADDIVLAPDGRRAFVNLQNKHYLVDVPRAGRETVEVRIQGRAENTAVPVKRMSLEGGDYPAWTARRPHRHLVVGRAVLPPGRGRRRARRRPTSSSKCRGPGRRARSCSAARGSSP